MRHVFLVALTLFLLVASCATPARGQDVIRAVNAVRAEHGLAPLAPDRRLAGIAADHAADQARAGAISHHGTDGRRLEDRLADRRYRYRAAAETVASGQRDAWQVARDWEESPAHRRAMLLPGATDAGVGLARAAGTGRLYWTMIVAER